MRSFDTSVDALETIHNALTARDAAHEAQIEAAARAIIDDVRARGDEAVREYTQRFDWPDAHGLEVPYTDLIAANDKLDMAQTQMLLDAAVNIKEFHEAERGHLQSWMHLSRRGPGRMVGQALNPVERVGVYVPGGKAAYPSTVLMAAIPAQIAGVKEIVICTPPDAQGHLPPLVSAAAAFHANRVFRVGGAQAIAAMAYGTQTIPRCDVIVGPGNAYVNAAKRLVYGQVGIDMLAGPSEIAVIADEGADAAFVAADLLAQTEHGPDNRGVLFSHSARLLEYARTELDRQRERLSRREILDHTAGNIIFVKTRSLDESLRLSNVLAPEHLELMVRDPLAALPHVHNAGAVLLGDYTSAPIGDYWAGPSHTLPTAGAARFSSPLSVATFLKRTSVLYYSREAAQDAAVPVARFAHAEGFDAHAEAARVRTHGVIASDTME
jgi:histidinol dehydrogenase